MYIITAVLKHYEDQGSHKEDLALVRWACEDALINIQNALKDIMKNLPVPFVGAICNFIIFPLTKPYQKPSDSLGRHVARKTLQPGKTLDRLCEGIFFSQDKEDATGRIQHAFSLVLKTDKLQHKIRAAYKQGQLKNRDRKAFLEAKENNIITDTEYNLLLEAEEAIQHAIKVDEFSFSDWKIETP